MLTWSTSHNRASRASRLGFDSFESQRIIRRAGGECRPPRAAVAYHGYVNSPGRKPAASGMWSRCPVWLMSMLAVVSSHENGLPGPSWTPKAFALRHRLTAALICCGNKDTGVGVFLKQVEEEKSASGGSQETKMLL